jgi:hypothetical protein
MSEWQLIPPSPDLPNWEPWHIEVLLGTMQDGTVGPIGLRIEPRADVDVTPEDQRLTLEKLRRFPIGYATEAAKALAPGNLSDRTDAAWRAEMAALDSQAARLRAVTRRDKARAQERAEREWEARVVEVGERQARLERVSMLYRLVQERPLGRGGARKEIAQIMGVSVTTVDRLLRDARSEGFLEPYGGAQGKHGKSDTE